MPKSSLPITKAMQTGGKKKEKKKKLPSISKLKRLADNVFSKWIRNRDSIGDYNWCVTCGKKALKTELQNGHYWSRMHMSTRYNAFNCHPQCIGCNMFKEGCKPEYTLYLIRKYGQGILQELALEKEKLIKFSRQDYLNIIEKYK